MAKKRANAKVQHPKRELSPCFDPGREFGGTASSISGTIISDAGGRLWIIDKGEGRPVKFVDK